MTKTMTSILSELQTMQTKIFANPNGQRFEINSFNETDNATIRVTTYYYAAHADCTAHGCFYFYENYDEHNETEMAKLKSHLKTAFGIVF